MTTIIDWLPWLTTTVEYGNQQLLPWLLWLLSLTMADSQSL